MTETPLASDAAVRLTPAAAARVAAIAARQQRAPKLRLAVDGGGCAGFTYRFELADAVATDDIVTMTDAAELVVDQSSHDLLSGSLVDYVESLGGASFQVRNPNAASGCGCGASFSI